MQPPWGPERRGGRPGGATARRCRTRRWRAAWRSGLPRPATAPGRSVRRAGCAAPARAAVAWRCAERRAATWWRAAWRCVERRAATWWRAAWRCAERRAATWWPGRGRVRHQDRRGAGRRIGVRRGGERRWAAASRPAADRPRARGAAQEAQRILVGEAVSGAADAEMQPAAVPRRQRAQPRAGGHAPAAADLYTREREIGHAPRTAAHLYVTTRGDPATAPANSTRPAHAARTVAPGAAARSAPRCAPRRNGAAGE